ncbi:hypothetical protein [Piscinibacter sp. HJYY11]|uniref:hypothetical protein n=1 Tax=Piscinibacter sp. HJYY11 TaxID=2801333 RepID=UPI00191D952F|nr:hypothetical protein [Piscinibacter sp. HJYY11]MBL0727950.1 hypothetical protein [Piscinibacter sp. HJYY11]
MVIFGWIIAGIAGLLFAFSAVCWGIHIAVDNSDWKRLGIKVFRIGLVFVLLYINVYVYAHIFGVMSGTQKPVAEVVSEE